MSVPLLIVSSETSRTTVLAVPTWEGLPSCDWVLIDTGDIIVHIFRPEVRAFYNIEKMWAAETDDDL